VKDLAGDAAERQAREAGAAVRAQHDQVGASSPGQPDDLVGRATLSDVDLRSPGGEISGSDPLLELTPGRLALRAVWEKDVEQVDLPGRRLHHHPGPGPGLR
jgi:hypothetical protein